MVLRGQYCEGASSIMVRLSQRPPLCGVQPRSRLQRAALFFAAVLGMFLAAPFGAAEAYVSPRLKPPPPGPAYTSPADHARLEVIIASLKRRNFAAARATADTVQDPIAKSLALWLYFYGDDPNADIDDARRFLDDHSNWPAASRIQSNIEKKLKNTTSPQRVLAFFDKRDPITGRGKLHLARAQFFKGDREAGEIHLRDAWANHTFSVKDERDLLANYGGRLRPEDHAARVDNLLWKRQVTNARRVFSRLTSAERRKANARAALLLRAANASQLYASLPGADRRDAGVMLAAVRYYRRTGEEPRAVSIARKAPSDPAALRNPSRWWSERQLLMRWAITEKRYGDAYAMAAGHGLEPSTDFSEAEFNAGWLALRYLKDPARATTHFKALAATVAAPISVARANYWLGRAARAAGDATLAESYFTRAARHRYTYYGQLAAERLGGAATELAFDPGPPPAPADRARFTARPTVAALKMLSELDDDQAFLVFAYHIDDTLESPGEYKFLGDIAISRGAPHITVRAGKVSVRRNAFAPDVSYPVVFVPDEATRYVSREIILGLSRQESEFNPRAFSRAGARGLMQLIPSTAKLTARKAGLSYSRAALLDDPVYNMTVGAAHLSHLLSDYNGSLIMTFAAYNAGPHRVTQWVERYGDPRAPGVDPVDWVEKIPFSETRNYVQRVLENTQVYRARLKDRPIPGQLSVDLERGGPRQRAGLLPGRSLAPSGRQPVPEIPARTIAFAGSAPDIPPEGVKLKPAPAVDVTLAPESPSGVETPVQVETSPEGDTPPSAEAAATPAPTDAQTNAPTTPKEASTDTAPTARLAPEPDVAGADPETRAVTVAPQDALSAPSAPPSDRSLDAPLDARPVDPSSAPAWRDPEPPVAKGPTRPEDERDPQAAAPATAARGGAALSADDLNSLQSGAIVASDSAAAEPPQPASNSPTPVAVKKCETTSETYREYIARVEKEEASAADLNAGMLAELKTGGPAC